MEWNILNEAPSERDYEGLVLCEDANAICHGVLVQLLSAAHTRLIWLACMSKHNVQLPEVKLIMEKTH